MLGRRADVVAALPAAHALAHERRQNLNLRHDCIFAISATELHGSLEPPRLSLRLRADFKALGVLCPLDLGFADHQQRSKLGFDLSKVFGEVRSGLAVVLTTYDHDAACETAA